MFKIREHAQAIIDSLVNNPGEWDFDEYRAIHEEKKVALWIACGASYLEFTQMPGELFSNFPEERVFNPWEKLKIYRACQKALRKNICNVFRSDLDGNKNKAYHE